MGTAFDPAVPHRRLDALRPRLPSPLHEVRDERLARNGLRLLLKRDDLIHPALPGNKWRKLVPNLVAAAQAGQHTLLTFGGAYSNHLRATAAAGRLLGLRTVGVVRGEELADRPLNPSLARCAADGMRLHFISRSAYRRRDDPALLRSLRRRFGEPAADGRPVDAADAGERVRLLPEGGSNAAAARGCVALGRELRDAVPRPDVVAVACGTGGTLAGLAAGLGDGQRAVGFSVLRGDFLTADVRRLQGAAFGGSRGEWRVEDRFHAGGYARSTPELRAFRDDFAERHGLRLEEVYVAKMLFGVFALADEGALTAGSTVAAVVTG